VTADGQSAAETFAITREPRLLKDVSDQDLREQFDLAMNIRNRTSQANEAVLLVRGIKAQIGDRKGKLDAAKAAPVVKALEDLDQTLSAIENEIYQVKLQSSQDPLNFPIKLNNKIAALQGVVESAESRPTDASYAVFKELSARLATELARLDALVKTDVLAFNKLLGRRAAPVTDDLPAPGAARKDAPSPGTRP
jgi:hypothetical protein